MKPVLLTATTLVWMESSPRASSRALLATFWVLGGMVPFLTDVQAANPAPPYPQSTLISDITWDFSTHVRKAEGSDNWPIT